MKILFIHLSDLHIAKYDKLVESKLLILLDEINKYIEVADSIFCIISGDVASNGRKEEYEEVSRFLEALKNGIFKEQKKQIEFIFAPGNHDCCFDDKVSSKDREIILQSITNQRHINESTIQRACKAQSHYENFVSKNSIHPSTQNSIISVRSFQLNNFVINFYSFNTSWMSMENEEKAQQPGKMYMPMDMFKNELFTLESNLNISVLHHPDLWRNPVNSSEFQGKIKKISDLVLVGHSHMGEANLEDNLEGNKTLFLNSGAFIDPKNESNCQFKTILFDTDSNKAQISSFIKTNVKMQGSKITEIKIKHKKFKKDCSMNEKTEKWANKLDLMINHSGKDNLFLSDLFVYPQLMNLTELTKQKNNLIAPVDSEKVFTTPKEIRKILILGDRKAGKTALLKTIYKYYYEWDFTPIFIDGSKIKSSSVDKFKKYVDICFVDQYSEDCLSKFHATNKNNKIIIIDDFDKARLSSNNSKALLSSITRNYKNIIITANSLFEINEFVTDGSGENPISEYDCYQIMQFGNLQIGYLVEQWHSLDDDCDEKQFLKNIDNSKKVIKTVFGKGFVNKYPFFALIILQSIQQADPEQLMFSTYGHYYDVMFRKSIGRLVKTNDNIDALFQFLPEMAYYLFFNRIKFMTIEIFENFRKWYISEYKISPAMKVIADNNMLSDTLVDASIISIDGGNIRFASKSAYYFFLARYMSFNIDQQEIKDNISNIAKRLYRDEFANIMLFLVHHTRSEFVLKELLHNSREIFKEFEPIKLENDVEGINSLMNEIPKLVLEEKNRREYRHEMDKIKDEIEPTNIENGDSDEVIDPKEQIMDIDVPLKIGMSVRIIEILGLILKNHHSSLKGNIKYEFGVETYSLGMRAIASIYSLFENNRQLVINNITAIIIQKPKLNDEKLKIDSEKYLFSLCLSLAYLYILVVSDSVGNENLSETFKDIKNNNPILSYELIDFAIKLGIAKGINTPMKDLHELVNRLASHKKTFENGNYVDKLVIHSTLPYCILVQLVQDYYNLYDVDDDDLDKMASIFGISTHTQNLGRLAYINQRLLN